jgi:hypothetical protein
VGKYFSTLKVAIREGVSWTGPQPQMVEQQFVENNFVFFVTPEIMQLNFYFNITWLLAGKHL